MEEINARTPEEAAALPKYRFVRVGRGRLALYHRPRRTDFSYLKNTDCTHVITLLKDSEGAERIGNMTHNAGLEWIWLPVPNGNYPAGEVHVRLFAAMPHLSQLLDEGKSLVIHCSAGIHRTGTVAYGLLRWRGMESGEAMRLIAEMRPETAEGMMAKRMRWGDDNARAPWKTSWLDSFKRSVARLFYKR